VIAVSDSTMVETGLGPGIPSALGLNSMVANIFASDQSIAADLNDRTKDLPQSN